MEEVEEAEETEALELSKISLPNPETTQPEEGEAKS
jgi:hypothetical protein